MRWLADEFDYRFATPDEPVEKDVLDYISEVNQAVGVGQPLDVPSQWPAHVRSLWEDSNYHFIGNRIYKRVSPEEAAMEGAAGVDILESDDEEEIMRVLDKNPDALAWLKEHHDEVFMKESEEDVMRHAITGVDIEKLHEVLQSDGAKRLDNPLSVAGYLPPKDSYRLVYVKERTSTRDAATVRHMHYVDLMKELEDIGDEEVLDRFLWRIRDDYYRDKKIRQEWNEKARLEARSIYEDSLRRQGKDEETIRRELWRHFDAKKIPMPSRYAERDGKRVKLSEEEYLSLKVAALNSFDSTWYRMKRRAFKELTLTYQQWNDIYTKASEIRKRCKESYRKVGGRSWNLLRQMVDAVRRCPVEKLEDLKQKIAEYDYLLIAPHRRRIRDEINNKKEACR